MAGQPNTRTTTGWRINVAQHNCRGSNDVFLSLFHIVRNFKVSFVCVQDPPLYNGEPLRAPGYECLFLKSVKVRVCTYVSLRILADISFVVVPREDDVLYLRVFAKEGKLVGQSRSFALLNAYNREVDGGHLVKPDLLFISTNEPTLVVGDLNIHTSFTDPLRNLSSGERRRGEHYMRMAMLNGYSIMNTPGVHTRFPDNPTIHRSSTIDYTLANTALLAKVSRWRDLFQRTGSDHIVILTEIDSQVVELARPAPNWEEIKWRDDEGVPNPAIEAALKDYLDGGTGYQDIVGPETAIETFEGNLRRLIMMVKSWAPMKRPTVWSKAWWTAEITELRRVYTSAARRVRRDGSGVQERDEARKVYRKAIVTAKRKH